MVKVLEETGIITVEEQIETELTLEEERSAAALGQYQEYQGADLSDGGQVGKANLFPTLNGQRQERGRPTARRAWMWNGTETLLPLAWNPDGTAHDGGRRYLRKRHCMCCGLSGVFTRNQCKDCVFNSCNKCNGSTNPKLIIAWCYLTEESIPYPLYNYGSINCFLPMCPRRTDQFGAFGFKTMEDMRIHARSRHQMEYQAHQETLDANKSDELDQLREQVNALLLAQVGVAVPQQVAAPVATIEPESEVAPLYVSDKPARVSKTRQKRKYTKKQS